MVWISTVLGVSPVGSLASFPGYRLVLKRVLTRVDLPRPDSPIFGPMFINHTTFTSTPQIAQNEHTNNHQSELESFLYGFAVDLVRKVVETDIASKLRLNNGNLAGAG